MIALFQTGLSKTLPVTIFSFLQSGVEPSVAAIATMLVGLVLFAVVASRVLATQRGRRAPARQTTDRAGRRDRMTIR